uniref:Uncharacterized protein LOC111133282 isoform X1 n=1 Tax=Crassostrea virginica TaxID=6565 RepID=A0A8B8ECH9_CRAVI|nr:uncharacterized protein LOC111133282 isoform X1 [Crassostrea virginica]XP_022337230.1 uncharacterized protein LOC111133282 isoform X1 [Crassostrea virginica]XP_022337231.1 uncharacterized protein LOC111133282 isoform X1 [Crassostrea virginica]XP_022337232.1 uncharacterized protein LOC111133282 isoform X1 [Crassostrea virginica]XP_022337233.1 uncharacterized protein LOC111133282 isoform X1 [Crassostrea virginica]XP_022337235.1 uncharacterized protein LOC111133282 isoform X1 [Crassostrea virg
MEPTRISTQVSVKHCSLCQGDTEYYCYGCRQDLCIQCKELHVIDLSTKDHEVTCYIERMKYPPKDESEESGDPDSRDSSKQVKSARSGNSEQVMCVRSRDPVPLPVWLSPSERSEMVRRLYSKTIYSIRGETIYNRLVMLKGVRQDLKTGHKAVTIRGQPMAGMIGQVPKDEIDEVLAGDLEDRCIIQKTRMTRHMTRLLLNVYRYEQLNDIMDKQPIKFLQIMTRKHNSPKIQEKPHTQKDQEKFLTQRGKKEMVNMVVNLMKGLQLVKTRKRQAPGTELLLTLMSSPVLQKSLSVKGVEDCRHISCVTQDRVWVSDLNNFILTDTATGKILHSVEHSIEEDKYEINYLLSHRLGLRSGKHTVNCDSELIYVHKDNNINKLSSDMKTTTTLIKHTNTIWEPLCVYCSPSSGDLLVGMSSMSYTHTGKVMRYDNTGKYKQTIPHNDKTPNTLYEFPRYITENNNGDVLVSDRDRGVVVTSGEGVHRFSYTGPPSGSRLEPRGICTDVMSHILVIDSNTDTVQMLDRDGQFLSYLLTTQSPGIHGSPLCLSSDVTNHVLWVGAFYNNTLSVYRYINRHLALSDTREHCDVSLSSEPFYSQHIPGLTQEEFDRQKEEKRRKWEEARRRRREKRRQRIAQEEHDSMTWVESDDEEVMYDWWRSDEEGGWSDSWTEEEEEEKEEEVKEKEHHTCCWKCNLI